MNQHALSYIHRVSGHLHSQSNKGKMSHKTKAKHSTNKKMDTKLRIQKVTNK